MLTILMSLVGTKLKREDVKMLVRINIKQQKAITVREKYIIKEKSYGIGVNDTNNSRAEKI